MAMYRSFLAVTASLLAAAAAVPIARADDAPPPPPPEHTWIGKGQIGYVDAKGNTDAETANGNIEISRFDGPWKNDLYLSYLYGKSNGVLNAERFEGHEQTNYALSGALYVFGGLRYEHDLFDGFQYQASLTSGLGYKIIDNSDLSLTAQVGAGYRWSRPETITKNAIGQVISRVPLEEDNEAVGTAGLDFSYKFTPTTTLTNKFYSEIGSMNTMLQDDIQLAVKMTTKLALAVGYKFMDNSNPPAPLKKLDTLATANLQFSF
jgi:putative salt-induced outer membrane protein